MALEALALNYSHGLCTFSQRLFASSSSLFLVNPSNHKALASLHAPRAHTSGLVRRGIPSTDSQRMGEYSSRINHSLKQSPYSLQRSIPSVIWSQLIARSLFKKFVYTPRRSQAFYRVSHASIKRMKRRKHPRVLVV